VEQYVIECFTALVGGGHKHLEVVENLSLTCKIIKGLWPELAFKLHLFREEVITGGIKNVVAVAHGTKIVCRKVISVPEKPGLAIMNISR
jgi:hypothetical protein